MLFVMEALNSVLYLLRLIPGLETLPLPITVITSLLFIVEVVYVIRVYAGLCEIYKVRRRWIALWIIAESVASMIWGLGKKYRPSITVPEMEHDDLAGVSGRAVEQMDTGLSVNLEERSVTEFFKKRSLLRDIHMNIEPGHLVLLLGGSGAGKTTFLNAVNGYEKAKAKVTLNGRDMYREYGVMKYQVGFVPQQNLMRGKDTVLHTMEDAALLRLPMNVKAAERRKILDETLNTFQLYPSRNHLVEKLSGGQLRRLSIAMEYLSDPELFILDEPDSGLDGIMARSLMEHLRSIADEGKIVIVITHTPDRVIDLFDDVIVLAKDSRRTGRLAFFGPVEEARTFFGVRTMEEIVDAVNKDAETYIRKYAEVANG
ncbi:MAG: ABC transporter ATP-binding protein [Spirochaetales bacterium]|nr:ABC transporter ATP-binding protein [Spirochaetales bacterium]